MAGPSEFADIVRELTTAQKRLIVAIAETSEVHAGVPGYYSGPLPYWNGHRNVSATAGAIRRRANLIEVRTNLNGWRQGVALTRDGEAVYELIKKEKGLR